MTLLHSAGRGLIAAGEKERVSDIRDCKTKDAIPGSLRNSNGKKNRSS